VPPLNYFLLVSRSFAPNPSDATGSRSST